MSRSRPRCLPKTAMSKGWAESPAHTAHRRVSWTWTVEVRMALQRWRPQPVRGESWATYMRAQGCIGSGCPLRGDRNFRADAAFAKPIYELRILYAIRLPGNEVNGRWLNTTCGEAAERPVLHASGIVPGVGTEEWHRGELFPRFIGMTEGVVRFTMVEGLDQGGQDATPVVPSVRGQVRLFPAYNLLPSPAVSAQGGRTRCGCNCKMGGRRCGTPGAVVETVVRVGSYRPVIAAE